MGFWGIVRNLVMEDRYSYMKKFLSVLGTIVRVVGQASGFIPMINPFVPAKDQGVAQNVEDKLSQALSVVVTAEQMFTAAYGAEGKKGSDKLKAATPFIAQLVQQSPLLLGKKIANETLFEDACSRLTAALADILNSVGQ